MDTDPPSTPQRIVAVVGIVALVIGVPVVIGVFGRTAVAWFLLVGGAMAAMLVVAILWKRAFVRRFPEIEFTRDDVSLPAAVITDATNRLAAGDYAAFVMRPLDERGEQDIYGQVWFYAGPMGGVERVAMELGYEFDDDPVARPVIAALTSGGWDVAKHHPGDWVVMERAGALDAAEAVRLVVDVLEDLYDLSGDTTWLFRAFA